MYKQFDIDTDPMWIELQLSVEEIFEKRIVEKFQASLSLIIRVEHRIIGVRSKRETFLEIFILKSAVDWMER